MAGGNRPGGIGGGGIGDRPGGGLGGPGRPGGGVGGIGDRPGSGLGPGRPGGGIGGIGDRPGGGLGPGRPGDNRPGGGLAGGGTRPGQGGSGERWRPGDNGRPIIGGGGNRPGNGNNIIGGGGNTIIGGGNNFVNNRPGGNWGINNGGGNWNNGNWNNGNWNNGNWNNWHDNWHNNYVSSHYNNWYNGAWNSNWGSNWYAPVAAGAIGWGLGSLYNNYAYGSGGYYNPYYSASSAMPYDYSQPIVVTNYVTADDTTAALPATAAPVAAAQVASAPAATPPPPQNEVALTVFDQGLADFKDGNYRQALTEFDAALKQMPNDPVIHEVRALGQFAVGDYKAAAAGLNSLLAVAPGMDWTTMAGLYGNVDDYTQQLRALEQHCKANSKDAAADFVLAYHYLVTGHQEAAIDALKVVVREQPKDTTAKRMLDALAPPSSSATATTAAPPPPPAADAPQTDLVGSWTAKAGDTAIDLTIGEDNQFTWKAIQPSKPPIELTGDLTASSDMLVLENKQQGSMVGRVTSSGPDKWQFAMSGAPPNDPGLTFQRVKR